jgi:hypothetical protein
MPGKTSMLRDLIGSGLVIAALSLPLLPVPGDGTARMRVNFRNDGDQKARSFTRETSRSVCSVMAAALTYENPDTGAFARVDCQD